MTKRFVSMMLALSMMLSLVPASAFADTGGGTSSTPVRTQALEEENSGPTIALNDIIADNTAIDNVGENDYPQYPLGCGRGRDQAVKGTGWSYQPYTAPEGGFGQYDTRGVLILEEGYTFTLESAYDTWIACDIINYGTIEGRGESRELYGDTIYGQVDIYGTVENYGTISGCVLRQWYCMYTGRPLHNYASGVIRQSFVATWYMDNSINDGLIENCYLGDSDGQTYTISGSGSITQCYFGYTNLSTTNDCTGNVFTKDPELSGVDMHTIHFENNKSYLTCEIPDTVEYEPGATWRQATFYFTGSPEVRVKGYNLKSINGVTPKAGFCASGIKEFKSVTQDNEGYTVVVLVPDGTQDIVLSTSEGTEPESLDYKKELVILPDGLPDITGLNAYEGKYTSSYMTEYVYYGKDWALCRRVNNSSGRVNYVLDLYGSYTYDFSNDPAIPYTVILWDTAKLTGGNIDDLYTYAYSTLAGGTIKDLTGGDWGTITGGTVLHSARSLTSACNVYGGVFCTDPVSERWTTHNPVLHLTAADSTVNGIDGRAYIMASAEYPQDVTVKYTGTKKLTGWKLTSGEQSETFKPGDSLDVGELGSLTVNQDGTVSITVRALAENTDAALEPVFEQAHDTFDANDFIVTGAPEDGAELEHTGRSVVDISAKKKDGVTKNYGDVHVWYYDTDGNAIPKPDGVGSYTYKITVDATDTCDGGTIQEGSFSIKYKPYSGSITLAASGVEYDGTPKAAVPIATDDDIGEMTVKGYYQQVNGEFDRTHLLTTITEGGVYLPVIDFAGSDTYLKLQNVTYESWMFVIAPRTLDGSEFTMTPPANLKADGSAKEVTVTVNAPYQLGKILAIRYFNEAGLCDPVKPGTYTVQISVAASNNNQDAFDLPVGEFTIEKADEKTATLTVNGKAETRTVGKNVTVTAEDRDGETFTGWTVEGVTLTEAEKAQKTISFTMPENDVILTANYKKVEKTATLTVNGKAETRTVGKEVTVTAEDRDGETFTGWTVEGVTLTEAEKAEKTISFTMPENDVILTANYKKTEIPDPTPDPEPDPTYKLTVIGADLTLEEGTSADAVKVGQLVTVKAWADTSTDRFAEWIITDAEGRELTPADLLGEDNEPLAADAFLQKELCFKMPSFGLNISVRTTPVTPDDPSSDGGSSKLAAIVETGAWLTGGALISYEVITTRYLVHALPEGTAIPTTRAQLALLLWQNAGKPEPAAPAAYMDVADADTAKAARWAVEEGLVSDKDDSTFTPDRFVTKLQVIRAWNKLKKLTTK